MEKEEINPIPDDLNKTEVSKRGKGTRRIGNPRGKWQNKHPDSPSLRQKADKALEKKRESGNVLEQKDLNPKEDNNTTEAMKWINERKRKRQKEAEQEKILAPLTPKNKIESTANSYKTPKEKQNETSI